MRFPIFGGAYRGRATDIDAQRCVNLFTETDPYIGEKYLVGSPGAVSFCDIGVFAIRGMRRYNGSLWVVSGNKLYEVDSDGTETERGTLNSSTGLVSMSDNGAANGEELIIVDGTDGYIWDSGASTFTQIADADFPACSFVEFMDGYFIVPVKDTGKFQISALYDGTSWNALDFATAEANPDNIVRVVNDHRELWLIGEYTSEIWFNSGDSDFPFARYQGGYVEAGCVSGHSVVKIDNSMMWLSRNERGQGQIIRVGEGYRPEVVSSSQIDYQLAQIADISDCEAFSYQQEGHEFAVFVFPSGGKTFVYDAKEREWHERKSDGQLAYRPNCHALFNGKNYVGDRYTGKVYRLDMGTYTENGATILRERVSAPLFSNDQRIFVADLAIVMEQGVGLTSGQGSDPQIMLQISDDGGHTYGNEYMRSFGKIGEYDEEILFDGIGEARNRVFKLSISDPVKVIIRDARLRLRNEAGAK